MQDDSNGLNIRYVYHHKIYNLALDGSINETDLHLN